MTRSSLGDIPVFTLKGGGLTARVLSRGAILQDLRLDGVEHSLVLGSPDARAYDGPMAYFGAMVGPVANRIENGTFTLSGNHFALDRNERNQTTLHGGFDGFAAQDWDLVALSELSCQLKLVHPDGRGGFPGPIEVLAKYTLMSEGRLKIDIEGTSPRHTVFSPAFHGYWNLDGSSALSGHTLQVSAERYLPVDGAKIPTDPTPVARTGFDYATPRKPAPDLDHNFCLAAAHGDLRTVCLLETQTVSLSLATTEPGLQVYTAGGMNTAPWTGHSGEPYKEGAGIALEPQGWPNAVNRRDFPSVVLNPGEVARQTSVFTLRAKS